jgi:hypothetical protein
MRSRFFTLIFLVFVFSCTAQKPIQIQSLNLHEGHVLLLPDSADAARIIVTDRTDLFFERVTAAEMSIQMKRSLKAGQTRDELLPAFLDYLRHDVENFTPAESVYVAEVMQEVFNTCQAVVPGIFPDTLIMLKTKGNHYGASVYYTRENCIIIPADVLGAAMRRQFTSTMYHELFHVYSRLNPKKRELLYRLIGFETIGLANLRLPEALAARVLHNPDGVDFAQKITLNTEDGKTIDAVPVIYANQTGFQPDQREFFGYVEFNLFQIEKTPEGAWQVLAKDDGYTSLLDLKTLPDFFRQIKDNTGYIIHPDEVLADNFGFLMQGKSNPKITARFSAEGKQLIENIEKTLKE